MLGQSTNRVASIAFAMLLITSMAAITPATAASNNNGFLDGVSEAGNDSRLGQVSNFVSTIPDFVGGLANRISYITSKQNPFADKSTTTAASEARDVQQYFNSHNDSFINYVNNRSAGGDAYDVWKLTIKQDGSQETLYLVATYNNSSNQYETAEMVNSTSRTVDETVTLEGYAAENAREELEYFHSNYVSKDKPVDSDYQRRLAGKYAGYVNSSILEESDG